MRLGTSIKITVLLDVTTVTTAKITIKDSCSAVKVNAVDMTKDADNVYSYIYQSATTDIEGDYEATISVTLGAYTSVSKEVFTLEE